MSTIRRLNEIGERELRNKLYGVVIGVVTDNVDPQGKYRVRVRFPWLPNGGESETEESWWCRVSSWMAGDQRGFYCLPEVGDEVLVAFEHGDMGRGYVLGALWSSVPPSSTEGKVDRPIYSNKHACGGASCSSPDQCGKVAEPKHSQPSEGAICGKHDAKKNDLRALRSRQAHQLVFNDNAEEPRVALSSSQRHRIVLDDKGNQPYAIEIYDGKEENYIRIDTREKKITVESKTGDLLLKAKKTIRLEAETIETASSGKTELQAKGAFSMDTKSTMSLTSSASGTIKASGALELKGQPININ